MKSHPKITFSLLDSIYLLVKSGFLKPRITVVYTNNLKEIYLPFTHAFILILMST